MNLPHNTLIAVADGAKLLLLRNGGDAANPALEIVEHETERHAATHDQGTDRPGNGHNSQGHGRSAVAQTDWHQLGEDRFAVHAADLLGRLATDGWAEHIVVVAPPKTLGEMRKHYGKAVETRLLGEMHKDLTGFPVDQIAAHLAAD